MKILLTTVVCFFVIAKVHSQNIAKGFFSLSSPLARDAKDYGIVNVAAEKHTIVISTVMASGENVKGLVIRINNGFAFKLAPAQTGTTLNYVGPGLNIVLQPGDKAKIEFIDAGKTAAKQLYVSGEVME